ncbi:MAG: methylmalonyl Co-A mutase-associated GTPase MeaB [Chloroflexi bacterium]|jgi:LAO/AO transport system kinase|nr:methylmalonyl Co-A mutase-associated GTPase MeaB [Chloroflexota bacterium]
MSVVQDVLNGSRLALSRLLSQIENNTPEGHAALGELFPHTGRAHLIGVTGAPGTGKSSLVNRLAWHYRHPPEGAPQQRVAIVAVDPSSPFTGGAVLGDRVRMRDLSGDPGVFIRSMASRGSLGGLAAATSGLVQAFDAAGFEMILIETVGAGQAEVEVARLAHTTLVVEAPGLGDDIQAIKAGILEIADILVVNKADRPGVEHTERALRGMLQLAHPGPRVFRHHGALEVVSASQAEPTTSESRWLPLIQQTIATEDSGLVELVEHIANHRQYLETSGEWEKKSRARMRSEFDELLQAALVERWRASVTDEKIEHVFEKLALRQIAPRDAVAALLTDETEI